MRTWRRGLTDLVAVVIAGTLVTGACGGDDDDADDSRRTDAPEDAAGPGSDATDATTAGRDDGTSDDAAAGSPADAAEADEADEIGGMDFCDGFRAAIRLDSATALAGVRQLEAPAEIAEDWQVFLDFAERSMTGEPLPGTAEEVEAAGAAAEEATVGVLDYVGRECGYSVDVATGEVSENGGG